MTEREGPDSQSVERNVQVIPRLLITRTKQGDEQA